MAPQYVKAYVKTNKNDYNDAEAINEAVSLDSGSELRPTSHIHNELYPLSILAPASSYLLCPWSRPESRGNCLFKSYSCL